MPGRTEKDLNAHIKDVIAPMVTDVMGSSEVADVIRDAVAESLKGDDKGGGIAQKLMESGEQVTSLVVAPQKEYPIGSGFACYVRALAAGRNDPAKAAIYAAEWGRKDVADAINAKAMGSNVPGAGGFLVPTEFSDDVIELLRASAVVRGLGPTVIPMATGTIKVPRITSGANASYIGENTNVTKSELETGQITLTFKKLAALVPISNDLIRYASPAADTLVRDDMIRALSAREDLAFIRDDGLNGKPLGIKNWIHADNKFTANTTVNLVNVTTDLGTAMQNLMDAEINLIVQQGGTGAIDVRPGWLFNPRAWKYLTTVQTGLGTHAFRDEMLRGTLWGYPFRVTTQVENTTVYFGAFAHAVIGEALGMTVDASQDAAYHDGNNVVAAYSQDQTVIRVIAEHDFALRHDKAFSLIESVTWGS